MACCSGSRAGDPVEQAPLSIDVQAGRVFVWDDVIHDWSQVIDPRHIPMGVRVRVDGGFQGQLQYADGTILRLKPHTWLQVLPDGLRLRRGSVWIKVTKRGRRFSIVTPSAIASVRGTTFTGEVPSARHQHKRILAGAALNGRYALAMTAAGMTADFICLTYLSQVLKGMPGGVMPTVVRVFEGTVSVARRDVRSGKVLDEHLVEGGDRITVSKSSLGPVSPLQGHDYQAWNLEIPSGVMLDQTVDPGDPPVFVLPADETSPAYPVKQIELLDQGYSH